jgi:predicted nucleotidyltransferase
VFGSTARSTATDASDIDIAVAFAPGPRGLARLERLATLRARLADLLGLSVDVIEEPARSVRIRRAIERDGVRAF